MRKTAWSQLGLHAEQCGKENHHGLRSLEAAKLDGVDLELKAKSRSDFAPPLYKHEALLVLCQFHLGHLRWKTATMPCTKDPRPVRLCKQAVATNRTSTMAACKAGRLLLSY